jgi:hypothetical protein
MAALHKKKTLGIITVLAALYLVPVLLADGPIIWGIILLVPVIVLAIFLIGIFLTLLTLAVPVATFMLGLLALTRAGFSRSTKAPIAAALFTIGLATLATYAILIETHGAEAIPLFWWLGLEADIQAPVAITVVTASSFAGIYLNTRRNKARRKAEPQPNQICPRD